MSAYSAFCHYLRYVRHREAGAVVPTLMLLLCLLAFLLLINFLDAIGLNWTDNYYQP